MLVQATFLFLFLVLGVDFASAESFLWSAGMETGNLSEWSLNQCGGEFNSGVSNSEASNQIANSGAWSAQMTIGTPSVPESGTRLFRWCEPQTYPELYYSTWYYLPQKYAVANYWNVFQWKSKTSTRNDPFFVLNIGNRSDGTMYFYLFDWQSRRSYGQSSVNIPVGRWFQVEAYYHCRPDNTGRVTIWQDATLLFDVTNVRTRYPDGDCQWSVDNYSDGLSPTPSTIFIDDAAISLTRIGLSTVTPAPAPTPPPPPAPTPPPSCRPRGKSGKCR